MLDVLGRFSDGELRLLLAESAIGISYLVISGGCRLVQRGGIGRVSALVGHVMLVEVVALLCAICIRQIQ